MELLFWLVSARIFIRAFFYNYISRSYKPYLLSLQHEASVTIFRFITVKEYGFSMS
ncbi:hypothetical protein [Mariniflexile sp.]|uniref:hypothetical protein n=1 Tax=Mariniflexile sp. TaxID=1979402 RepID=UPI0035675642